MVTRRSPIWAGSLTVVRSISGTGGNRSERGFDLGQHFVEIECTGDDDDRIVWRVETPVVVVEIIARHRFEVVLGANDQVAVTVRAEGGAENLLPQQIGGI